MSKDLIQSNKYREWLENIKSKIRSARTRAAFSLNSELIKLYWDIGKELHDKVDKAKWGAGIVDQLSIDLKNEFPDMKGTGRSNLFSMKQLFSFYNEGVISIDIVSLIRNYLDNIPSNDLVQQPAGLFEEDSSRELVQQAVGLIPWSHNVVIVSKEKDVNKALWYVIKTAENAWTRDILLNQLESDLYSRQAISGKNKTTNFKTTLPAKLAEEAENVIKDPYLFDFIKLSENAIERDLENQLISHISKFLLELGKGFAYVGQQYHLAVSSKDFYIDILFYHLKLHAYVVIELKTGEFKPEYAGQLNFYLSAVDEQVKDKKDNPTIGILICKSKDDIVAKYSLQGINKPMGITEYKLTKALPKNLKPSLPTIEEIEAQLSKNEL
jgi:predicted nuclease of restriction endonuclease-like (RecB) superfamily